MTPTDLQPTPTLVGKLIQGSIWLWLQQATDIGLVFIFTSILLRLLGPDGFGMVVLTQSALNIAGMGTLNIEYAAIRYLPDFRGQGLWRTARILVVLIVGSKLVLALLVGAGLFALAPWIAEFYEYEGLEAALRVGCFSLVAAMMARTGETLCLGYMQPQARTAITTVRRVSELIALLFVSTMGATVVRAIAVLAFGDTVAALGYGVMVARYFRRDPAASGELVQKQALVRRVLAYCMPLLGAQVMEVAGQNAGNLVLGRLASPTVLGLYGVARLAGERLMLFMTQAPSMAVPVIVGQEHTPQNIQKAYPLIHRLLTYQWALAGAGNLAIWAAAPLIAQILGGAAFGAAADPLRIMGFAILLWAGTASVQVFFKIHERTAGNFYLNLGLLSVSVGMYFLLVPSGGAVGGALADACGHLIALGVGIWLARRWFGFEAWDALRPLAAQLGWLVALTVPVWLLGVSGWGLAVWLAAALGLFGRVLLRGGVPAHADLTRLEAADWGRLNGLKGAVCRGLLNVAGQV